MKKNAKKSNSSRKKRHQKKATTKKAITKIVKKTINRMSEEKVVVNSFAISPRSLQGSTTGGVSGNYWIMNPSDSTYGYTITQGTADDNRVGDKVLTSRCYLNLSFIPTQYDATLNPFLAPQYVVLYIYKYRQVGNVDPNNTNLVSTSADFFQNSGVDTGFSGQLLDMLRILNKDKYKLYARKILKIGMSIPPTSSSQTANYSLSNNDFKFSKTFKWNITKYLPKTIHFDDSNLCQDNRIIFLVQPISATGGLFGPNQYPLAVQGQIQFFYRDL